MTEGSLEKKLSGSKMLEILRNPPNFCASPLGSFTDLTREDMFQREEFFEDRPIRDILYSIQNGDIETVSSQLTRDKANHRCNTGWCLVHYAAYHGQTRIVEIMYEKGAKFTQKTKNGHLPIHLAAWRGHTEVIKLMLERDRSMSSVNSEDNYTPLHWAAMEGHVPVLQELVAAGAQVNAKSTNGNTALHFAAQNGHNTSVTFLLESGADPDIQNELGDTPLHCATWKELKVTMKLLIEHNCNPRIRNKAGKKPVDELKGKGTDLIRMLNMAESKHIVKN